MITFQCYSCQQVLRVPDDKGGRKAKCPKCGTALTIPVASGGDQAKPPAAPPRPTTPVPKPSHGPAPGEKSKARAAVPAVPMAEIVAGPAPKSRRQTAEAVQPGVRAVVVEEDDDLDDEEPVRPKKPVSQKARWRWVGIGFLIVFINNCVLAGALLLKLVAYMILSVGIVSAMSGSRSSGMGSGDAMWIMWRISEILAACTTLGAMVGYVFCIFGPNKYGSMGLAIATVAVAFVELLFSSIFKIPFLFETTRAFGREYGFGTWFMLLLTNLFLAATVILFPLYLWAVGKARKDYDFAGACMKLVFMAGGYAGQRLIAWVLFWVYLKSSPSSEGAAKAWVWINLIMLWIGAVLFAGFLVRYIILLWRARDTVD